jgi:hypothetical protein
MLRTNQISYSEQNTKEDTLDIDIGLSTFGNAGAFGALNSSQTSHMLNSENTTKPLESIVPNPFAIVSSSYGFLMFKPGRRAFFRALQATLNFIYIMGGRFRVLKNILRLVSRRAMQRKAHLRLMTVLGTMALMFLYKFTDSNKGNKSPQREEHVHLTKEAIFDRRNKRMKQKRKGSLKLIDLLDQEDRENPLKEAHFEVSSILHCDQQPFVSFSDFKMVILILFYKIFSSIFDAKSFLIREEMNSDEILRDNSMESHESCKKTLAQ